MFCSQLLIVLLLGYHLTDAGNDHYSRTIVNILLQYFVHPYEAIQLDRASTNQDASSRQRDLIDGVLVKLAGRLAVRFYSSRSLAIKPRLYHLVYLDGYEALGNLLAQRDSHQYDSSGYYLIVISERDPPESIVENILIDLWKLQIVNVNVVLERNGHILVYTYFPYREGYCRRIRPELLFNLTFPLERDPRQMVFYWNRLRNFYGCPLLGGTFEAKPYTIYHGMRSDGSFQVSGFEGDLMQVLAKKQNFTLRWKNSPEQWGFARPVGNSTGLMKMAQEEEVDFAIGCLAMDPDRYHHLKAGISHYTSKILFAVPQGRPYTAFEKLLGPFQTSLLEMIGFVLILTGLVILALSFTNQTVRAFVYGRSVTTPFLNAVALLYGGSIPRPPVRNFARTLLLFWLIYCFIIGSLYQGSLFRYLQKPMQYPPLKTMNEIDRSGLHYYMVDIGTRFFVHNPNIVRRTIIIPSGKDSLGHKVAQLGVGLADGVVLSPMDLVAYNNRVNPRSRFVHIAREHVSIFPVGLYYPKRSVLRDVFDEQVRMIVPSGLSSDWVKRYGDYDFFSKPKEKSEPSKLSIRHLAGCYQLYGCFIGASMVVFLLEMVSPRFPALQAMLRHLIE